MKYLSREIYEKSLDAFSKNIVYYENEWRNRLKQYWAYYNSISSEFDHNFVTYYKRCAMHDDEILKIDIDNKNINMNIIVYLKSYLYDNIYSVIYENIHTFEISSRNSIGTYLYGEILKNKDGHISHEFLTSSDSSFYLTFDSLAATNIYNE